MSSTLLGKTTLGQILEVPSSNTLTSSLKFAHIHVSIEASVDHHISTLEINRLAIDLQTSFLVCPYNVTVLDSSLIRKASLDEHSSACV